ncbi:tripartite tricarboxylate transporter TctB family protein [Asanoa sp. NPDC050611]|uniref:tripartite tricarboxylate transporter TctB family protein n=1 Tax=Asanoa sp. NPDC050611 TaxID=3157098 RepID=UPI0033DEB9E7
MTEPDRTEASPLAGLAAGVVLVVAGVALFTRALVAGAENGITLGGPTTAPIVVTGLWVVVAVAYLGTQVAAWRRRGQGPIDRPAWRAPLLLLALLVAYAVVLKYTAVGYVLATLAFYVGAAQLLSTRPLREVIVRDAIVGAVLALGIYLAFTKLLGIVLPAGVLPL